VTTVSYTTPGTYNWICPAGVTSVTVECWAPGGGAGAGIVNQDDFGMGDTYTTGGTGAGGGGYSKYTCTVVPGRSYTVTVGAGAGGATDPGNFDVANGIFDGGNSQASDHDAGDSTFVDSTNGHVLAGAQGGGGSDSGGGIAGAGGSGDYSTVTTVYGTLVDHANGVQGTSVTSGPDGTAGGSGGNGGSGGTGALADNNDGGDGGFPGGGGGGGSSGALENGWGPAEESFTPLTAIGGSGANGQVLITYPTSGPNQSANAFFGG
jgi:hypothetical protein